MGGLEAEEVVEELQNLLWSRCNGCLVNAMGDLLQGNQTQAVMEMQRLELLAAFAEGTDGIELRKTWEIAPALRQRLMEIYTASASSSPSRKFPDVRLLEATLGLVTSSSVQMASSRSQ